MPSFHDCGACTQVADTWTNVTDFLLPTPPDCGALARSQAAEVRSGVHWYIYGGVSTGKTGMRACRRMYACM